MSRRIRSNPAEADRERKAIKEASDGMKADQIRAGRAHVASLVSKKQLADGQMADREEKESVALGQMVEIQDQLRKGKTKSK